MRIAYISSGAAGMYCGTCLHDNTLAAALIKKGHEVALVPTYTPTRTDEPNVSIDRIFYGGLNVYLQEKVAFFRRAPVFLDRIFNNPRLLSWLAQFGASTDARELGALTVSVLKGEHGHQKTELDKLVTWLKDVYRPDLVHLNLSLFLGFAKEIKRALGVPILCSVQGEDLFLGELVEPYRSEAIRLLRERARNVDGFIATSDYYVDYFARLLQLPREEFNVVRLGINLEGHGSIGLDRNGTEPFVIGYLARICPEKGLHLLVDAFRELHKKAGAGKIKLRVAGYLSKKDRPYFEDVHAKVNRWNLNEDCEFLGEVDRAEKISFLNTLDLLSVPTTYAEPKGLFVLEALANGVPVVQPRHGSFPEMIAATGGGLLVEPNSAEALAAGIQTLLEDVNRRRELGRNGRQAVHRFFSDEVMADATLEIYQKYLTSAGVTSRVEENVSV